MDLWPQFDRDLKEILTLSEAIMFIDAVYEEFLPKDGNGKFKSDKSHVPFRKDDHKKKKTKVGDGGRQGFRGIPISKARTLGLVVDSNNNVHVLDALKSVVRGFILNAELRDEENDLTTDERIAKLEEVEKGETPTGHPVSEGVRRAHEMLQKLSAKFQRQHGLPSDWGTNKTPVEDHVAATQIQQQFKTLLHAKRDRAACRARAAAGHDGGSASDRIEECKGNASSTGTGTERPNQSIQRSPG